jgi:hypothetical protein
MRLDVNQKILQRAFAPILRICHLWIAVCEVAPDRLQGATRNLRRMSALIRYAWSRLEAYRANLSVHHCGELNRIPSICSVWRGFVIDGMIKLFVIC